MENRIEKLIKEVANIQTFTEYIAFEEHSTCPFCLATHKGWRSMRELKHEEGCTWLLARELYNNGVGDDEKHQEV